MLVYVHMWSVSEIASNVEYAEVTIPSTLLSQHHWRLIPNIYYGAAPEPR